MNQVTRNESPVYMTIESNSKINQRWTKINKVQRKMSITLVK